MSEIIKEHMSLYRLAYAWAGLFFLGSVCSTTLAALQGVEWRMLSGQAKFCIVVAIISNLCTVMGAFISQAYQRARQGKDIIPSGDSNPEAFKKP